MGGEVRKSLYFEALPLEDEPVCWGSSVGAQKQEE